MRNISCVSLSLICSLSLGGVWSEAAAAPEVTDLKFGFIKLTDTTMSGTDMASLLSVFTQSGGLKAKCGNRYCFITHRMTYYYDTSGKIQIIQ